MPTAAIIIADGYTDAEFLVAYHMLKAEGFHVTVYSPYGGPVTGVMGWVHKTSRPMTYVDGNIKPTDILVLIGGVKSIEKIRLNTTTIDWIKEHCAAGKVIASICHGAQLLIEADIVRGRTVLGYDSIRKDLENAGAHWPDGCETFIDGNIVSARHYDFAGQWIKQLLRFKFQEDSGNLE